MEAKGQPADVVTEFARPIPSLILCDLLGVSRDERGRFDRATAAFLDDPEADFEENIRAVRDLLDYVRGVVERKRVEPQDDLLSDFITNAGDLTDDELVGAAWFLFAAGAHSTATMLALSVFALLYEPDRWQALQSADHMELEGAVEELLRYLTIFQVGTMRKASEDVDIDGVRIAAGDNLTVSLASANRDDARFAEPDRFDPLREAVGHLAFGGGRHKCLGQHLARLELQIALAGLLKRFPTLRLAGRAEDTPMHSAALALYGVDELLVSW
jgi:cytochrome P450